MDYKYTGIILNKRDIGETDRIYTIYTKEAGKIRVLGKGVRKPNAKLAGSLEPLTLAEIFLAKGSGMGKITGAIVANNFSGIKSDLEATEAAFYVFRLAAKTIGEQEKDEQVFGLFLDFLESLDRLGGRPEKIDILTLGFFFKLMDNLGYRLEVGKCVDCGNKLSAGGNYFSASRGGVLCGRCASPIVEKSRIGDGTIKIIRIFLKNKLKNLEKIKVSPKDVSNLRFVVKEAFDWFGN